MIHDLRHTHVSGLIADGWDPVEVAGRIGDTLATTLRVYSHEFDSARPTQRDRPRQTGRKSSGYRHTARQGNGGSYEVLMRRSSS